MKKSQSEREADLELASVPTLAAVEKAIGIKAAKWKNRCHEIACKMLTTKVAVGIDAMAITTGLSHGTTNDTVCRFSRTVGSRPLAGSSSIPHVGCSGWSIPTFSTVLPATMTLAGSGCL